MSAISGINSGSYTSHVNTRASNRGGGPPRLENDLASFLTQQGVSADDQTQIQSEIKDGISSASNGGRPDFAAVQNVVSQVLNTHGLSGDDFASSLPKSQSRGRHAAGAGPSGGPPPPGPPPSAFDSDADDVSSSTSTQQSSQESFIQKLLALLSQNKSDPVQSVPATEVAETPGHLDLQA